MQPMQSIDWTWKPGSSPSKKETFMANPGQVEKYLQFTISVSGNAGLVGISPVRGRWWWWWWWWCICGRGKVVCREGVGGAAGWDYPAPGHWSLVSLLVYLLSWSAQRWVGRFWRYLIIEQLARTCWFLSWAYITDNTRKWDKDSG